MYARVTLFSEQLAARGISVDTFEATNPMNKALTLQENEQWIESVICRIYTNVGALDVTIKIVKEDELYTASAKPLILQ